MSLTNANYRSPISKRTLSSLDWISLLDRESSVVGKDALRLNAVGWTNTVFGYQAASLGTTGDNNVAVGTRAAQRAEGSRNTAVGTLAYSSNVSGFDNVAVGYLAGGAGAQGDENTFLGGLAGLTVSSSGNVGLGFRSCAGARSCADGGNVAVGWYSDATGGGAVALGPRARATAAGAVALGASTVCSGANSLAAGPGVTVTGAGALVLMPRRDGLPSSHTAAEELNVFGVLTGAREATTGVYRAELRSDALRLEAGGNTLTMDGHSTVLIARSNVVVAAPLVAVAGLRVVGEAAFTDPATFNQDVLFNRDVRITGRLLVDSYDPREGVFSVLRVIEDASFGGLVTASNLLAGAVTAGALTAGSVTTQDLSAARLTLAEPLRLAGGFCNLGPAALEGETVVRGGQLLLEREGLALAGFAVSGGALTASAGLRVEGAAEADFMTYAHFHAGAFFHETLTCAGRADFDDLAACSVAVEGNLGVEGLAVLRALEARRADVADLAASNLTVAGDAYFGGEVSLGSIDAEDIVCDTILVKGARGLRVLGISELNAVTAADETTARLTVTGAAALCNVVVSGALRADGPASLGDLAVRGRLLANDALAVALGGYSVYGCNAAFSNLRVPAGGSLQVYGAASMCNGLRVQGNTVLDGDLTVLGSFNYAVAVNVTPVFTDNAVFSGDVTVLGSVTGAQQATFADGVRVSGELATDDDIVLLNKLDATGQSRWRIGLSHPDAANRPEYADLEIRSWKGTVFNVCQDFEQGVLNFTGSHRCAFGGGLCEGDDEEEPGTILVASGRYMALDGCDRPRVSESLPVVHPSLRAADPRAFGVLAGPEEEGADGRRFRIATLCFSLDRRADPAARRVVVNSAGEGGVLVCDEGGPVANGDLLTTSSFRGVGMRQAGPPAVLSHTVAKATCDCAFGEEAGDGGAPPWRWRRCPETGRLRRVALVGCTYKF